MDRVNLHVEYGDAAYLLLNVPAEGRALALDALVHWRGADTFDTRDAYVEEYGDVDEEDERVFMAVTDAAVLEDGTVEADGERFVRLTQTFDDLPLSGRVTVTAYVPEGQEDVDSSCDADSCFERDDPWAKHMTRYFDADPSLLDGAKLYVINP